MGDEEKNRLNSMVENRDKHNSPSERVTTAVISKLNDGAIGNDGGGYQF